MLRVKGYINGNGINALVDTGCNKTTIYKHAPRRCGLLSIIDTRIKGIAIGVGNTLVIGNIHFTIIKLGSASVPFSMDVEDDLNVDRLLGLEFIEFHKLLLEMVHNSITDSQTSIVVVRFDKMPYYPKHVITVDKISHYFLPV